MCGSDIFLGIIAILFPPLAVWVKRGICSADSLINICLCVLGFLPGLFHAWYILAAYPDPTYEQLAQDEEGGNVTYYYVQQGAAPTRGGRSQRGYGTVGSASAPNAQFHGQQQGVVPAQQQQYQSAEGMNGQEIPPTYQEAVKGDNKVQRQG